MSTRYCTLSTYGCIEVRGADAASFLEAQLSRRVAALEPSHAPLAGWHDPQGRVRALVRVLRGPDRWLLVTHAGVVASTAQRLAMFVLRSAVTVAPARDVAVGALLAAEGGWLQSLGVSGVTRTDGVVTRDGVAFVRVGSALWHLVGAPDALAALTRELPRASEEDAALAEIGLGIPAIGPALVGRFVAQMLDLDRLDALSFDKGCYPGQEIIARVHHRGSVKRRMRRYACAADAAPPVPAEVVRADGVAVGEVVRSARAGARTEILAVVENVSRSADLRVSGAPLRELPLRYSVEAD